MKYTDMNRDAMDMRARSGWRWAEPVTHEVLERAGRGDWSLRLTPGLDVPSSWYPELAGADVLGLASAGGQQIPVLAALGAEVTSMDLSPEMLGLDGKVCGREGLSAALIEADMTERFPFPDSSFDLIFFPVSLCYVRDISFVFRECARVLRKGGILMTGQDSGLNYLFDGNGNFTGKLPFDPLSDERLMEEALKDGSGVQFSHTAAEILSAMLNAGFSITDIYDDTNGEGVLHEHGVPSFIAVRAVKMAQMTVSDLISRSARSGSGHSL